MHAGKLSTSKRLQRTLAVLQQAGGWMSTRQIADVTNSCAVHSDIAGLRANGVTVEVKAMGNTVEHRRVFYYRLAERAPMLPGMEEAAT